MLKESAPAREEARKSAQIATEKMILAAEKIEKSNNAAISAAALQAGQPPGSQVLAKQALEADRTPPSLATVAAAPSDSPDATTAVKPTESGDVQVPEPFTPTAPVAPHQTPAQPEPIAVPPVSDSAEPSTSTTEPAKTGWLGLGKLFKSR